MAATGLRRAWMSRRRLRWLLFGLWLLLVLPSLGLILQTERQIKWEAYHHYRALAEELSQRIHQRLSAEVQREDARSVSDYQFLTVGGDPTVSRLLQRSALATFPPGDAPSGLLGHFQVDAAGSFTTPLLPASAQPGEAYGLSRGEWQARGQRSRELLAILARNELLATVPAAASTDDAERPARLDSAARSELAPMPAEADGLERAAAQTEREQALAEDKDLAEAPAGEPAPPPPVQALSDKTDYLANQRGFDALPNAGTTESAKKAIDYGRLEQLKLRQNYADEAKRALADAPKPNDSRPGAAEEKAKQERAPRKEQVVELGKDQALDALLASLAGGKVRLFEGELDPLEFSLLGSGHGVLYRKVWRDGQRWIQGLLFEQSAWLDTSFAQPFRASPLAAMSDLLVVYRGDVLQALPGSSTRAYVSAEQLQGEVLLQTRLPAPYADLQLVWTINQLPAGPGARAVRWTGALLLGVLTVVFLLLYRLGGRQIDLARQQQDFVSAVSHELKTPLTSIRMYGELLLQGWASEDKKREYYGFIHDESERLSRLIGNVLQLARMERNELQLNLEVRSVASLVDLARSKLSAQLERAGFVLRLSVEPEAAEATVRVDSDALLQILINLVDNAQKFSVHASNKQVDVSVHTQGDRLAIRVRDYGPGIPQDQLQKIFRLFYRVGSELTRETVGTGIGLALARQLAQSMAGELDVRNREPGAEFEVRLPLATAAKHRDGVG